MLDLLVPVSGDINALFTPPAGGQSAAASPIKPATLAADHKTNTKGLGIIQGSLLSIPGTPTQLKSHPNTPRSPALSPSDSKADKKTDQKMPEVQVGEGRLILAAAPPNSPREFSFETAKKTDYIDLAKEIIANWKAEPIQARLIIQNFFKSANARQQHKFWCALLLTEIPKTPYENVFLNSKVYNENDVTAQQKNDLPRRLQTDVTPYLYFNFREIIWYRVKNDEGSWDSPDTMAAYVGGAPDKDRDPLFYGFLLDAIPDQYLKELDLTFHFSGKRHPLPLAVMEKLTAKTALAKFTCMNCRFEGNLAEYAALVTKSHLKYLNIATAPHWLDKYYNTRVVVHEEEDLWLEQKDEIILTAAMVGCARTLDQLVTHRFETKKIGKSPFLEVKKTHEISEVLLQFPEVVNAIADIEAEIKAIMIELKAKNGKENTKESM